MTCSAVTTQAREGIDTGVSHYLMRCAIFGRNEISAREGIDTSIIGKHPVPVPGKRISVRTLDLNMDFEKIKEQLDKIAEEHFGEEV